jgi:16S rRNA (guanine527-N7)-methyltransferase
VSPEDRLVEVLERARSIGYLGPGPVTEHLAHSDRFADALAPSAVVAELGSGGGVPGLVVAVRRPDCRLRLIEASQGRADHLERARRELGLEARLTVDARPAEVVGRDPHHRGRYDAVLARGFGPPAVTAECAAPLLRVGGHLIVSEPPGDGERRWAWLTGADLPLIPVVTPVAGLAVLELTAPCPDRYPRRPGVPRRRPLAGA